LIPAIDTNLKDWIQAISWAAAGAGVIVAFLKYWSEVRAGREQRAADLRWRQAEAGKSLNDEMLTDPKAWAAMQMLDYSGRTFDLPSGEQVPITHNDVADALGPKTENLTEKQVFIRDSFDSLFYYMAMLEHYIASTLIRSEDVAYPLDYYVPLLAQFKAQVSSYLSRYKLTRTGVFLSRYDAWRKTPPTV
jgi:hypothetical protein